MPAQSSRSIGFLMLVGSSLPCDRHAVCCRLHDGLARGTVRVGVRAVAVTAVVAQPYSRMLGGGKALEEVSGRVERLSLATHFATLRLRGRRTERGTWTGRTTLEKEFAVSLRSLACMMRVDIAYSAYSASPLSFSTPRV